MRVLVMSAHPDDETLGCAGTLLKHRDAGDGLYWLIATQVYEPLWSPELFARKAEEVKQVAEAYGMTKVFKLGLPTVRLDTIPQADLFARIRDVLLEVKPEVVYLVHEGDVATDHQALFTAAMSVLKPSQMARYGVRRILSYECLSSTEAAPPRQARAFVPTVFHDISAYLEQKIEIMCLYKTELQPDPNPRGPRALRAFAQYRGAMMGVDAAETFMLLREIVG